MILVLGALVVVNLYVFVWDKKTGVRAIKHQAEAQSAAGASPSMTIPSQPLAATGSGAPTEPLAPAPVGPPATIEGKVMKSDTLGKLLKKSGLSAAEADEVIRALSGVLDFRSIRAGQSFRIERGPDGRVKRFELDVTKSHHIRAERQPSGELVGAADAPT